MDEELAKVTLKNLPPDEQLDEIDNMLEDSIKRVRLMRHDFKGLNEDVARVCDILAEKGYGFIAAGFHLGMLAICRDDCRIYCELNGFTDDYPNE